ncbi:MAG: hypothetical protein M3Z16_05025, partial [Pseudomonadota bacterium]|nr:hypothetical protein [Pseudomonadota bacterium]
MTEGTTRFVFGSWLVLLAALIGLGIALFNYLWSDNGIHGTGGALLVVASTVVMLLVAGALLRWATSMPRWLRAALLFLLLVDIVGTGFAAY